ncbi:MAG: hypothetical protein ACLQD8_00620 [Thermoplasmata archaeon]
MAPSSREPTSGVDPTAAIVRRDWSEWLPYLDQKGLFPRSNPPTGGFPYEPRGSARPAVYELAREKGSRGDREVLYVGKTTGRSQGIRTRLLDHYTIDDPLYDRIVEALLNHFVFVARFIQLRLDEVPEAVRLEGELRDRLQASRYPWNLR